MPQESYKKNGETKYNDTFHAITAEARTALVEAVTTLTSRSSRSSRSRKTTLLSRP